MAEVLLIRADASTELGTGHVMRCLALAQGWRAIGAGPVVFAAYEMPSLLAERIEREGMSLRRLPTRLEPRPIIDTAEQVSASHVVLDGYQFGDNLEEALVAAGRVVLSIDDYGHARHRHAHLVLNPNVHADGIDYSGKGQRTRLLLGTRYALLRKEFWKWRERPRRQRNAVRVVLVTMGGGDAAGFSSRALEALLGLPFSVKLLVGATNPGRSALEQAASVAGAQVVVDAADMSEQMDSADLAISAAGSTAWELLFMAVPSLVVALADNQRLNAQSLQERGAACSLGWHEDLDAPAIRRAVEALVVDAETRDALSRRGLELVDGSGAERVARLLRNYGQPPNLRMRTALAADEYFVWRVNNQPSVRRNAIHVAAIPYETHLRWFSQRLADPDCMLLVAMDEDVPIGVVRFDRRGESADISIALDEAHRGVGLGMRVIALATQRCCEAWSLSRVHARVRPENIASRKAFAKAGYMSEGSVKLEGVELESMVMQGHYLD